MKKAFPIFIIGFLVLTVSIAGMSAHAYFARDKEALLARWVFSVTLLAVAIITFFGFLWYAQKQGGKWALLNEGIRLAIVITVFTVYLVLVGIVAFFEAPKEVPEITRMIIPHFTSVVLVIVTSYFVSSAYVQVREKKKNDVAEEEESLPKKS